MVHSEVELKKDGKTEKVGYEDRLFYIEQVLRVRLMESHTQMEALRKGIMEIIPEPF